MCTKALFQSEPWVIPGLALFLQSGQLSCGHHKAYLTCFSLLLELALVLSVAFSCCLSWSTAAALNSLSCIFTVVHFQIVWFVISTTRNGTALQYELWFAGTEVRVRIFSRMTFSNLPFCSCFHLRDSDEDNCIPARKQTQSNCRNYVDHVLVIFWSSADFSEYSVQLKNLSSVYDPFPSSWN